MPDFDLMTWGFPCTDISIAGKQEGLINKNGSKTRSGLYYDGLRILQTKKPKYSIIENVKNLTQKKFKKQFEQILYDLDVAGYNSYWKVLNAKDFGIPQNRERVFIISIRKDIKQEFIFPDGYDNGLRLADVLSTTVEEKYYLNQEKVNEIVKKHGKINIPDFSRTIRTGGRGSGLNDKHNWDTYPVYKSSKSCSLRTRSYINQPQQLEVRKDELSNSITTVQKDSMILEQPIICEQRCDEGLRFFKDNICGTIRTINAGGDKRVIETDFKIRKLTPLECFRLMGFDDKDFYILKDNKISDSQIYKMAGNSIVVNVLEEIFNQLFNTISCDVMNNQTQYVV